MYEEALQLSDDNRGYQVVHKRDVDEIYINNYNKEWIMAWDSNMDISIVLDFHAVICYITDYYMKDETGTVDHIRKALSNDESGELRKKMNIVKNTFLTHRQAGECEIYYKLFPFLHFTQSNISTALIPTGFRKNMSRYLKYISQEEAANREDALEVDDKPGKLYLELGNLYDKYLSREDKAKDISYVQFAQRYEPGRAKKSDYADDEADKANKSYDDDGENDDEEEEDEYIFHPDHEHKLANIILYGPNK